MNIELGVFGLNKVTFLQTGLSSVLGLVSGVCKEELHGSTRVMCGFSPNIRRPRISMMLGGRTKELGLVRGTSCIAIAVSSPVSQHSYGSGYKEMG